MEKKLPEHIKYSANKQYINIDLITADMTENLLKKKQKKNN